MHCGGISNDLELQRKNENNMSLKHVMWGYFKRLGTAEKTENKDGKWCILTGFETI